MAGDEAVARWIANKLKDDQNFSLVESIGSGFLELAQKGHAQFTAVAIGIHDVVRLDNVASLFTPDAKHPQFVVNVPTKTIWSGPAIEFVHQNSAAFGGLGDLARASRHDPVWQYRKSEFNFFERAFHQHAAVQGVTRLYDRVFQLSRRRGMPDITVVLVDAYDMSAEDIRNARSIYGQFDAVVKTTSYGSVTTAAREAAASMGAGAFKYGELMRRLHSP